MVIFLLFVIIILTQTFSTNWCTIEITHLSEATDLGHIGFSLVPYQTAFTMRAKISRVARLTVASLLLLQTLGSPIPEDPAPKKDPMLTAAGYMGVSSVVSGALKRLLRLSIKDHPSYDYKHQKVMCAVSWWYNGECSKMLVICPGEERRDYDFQNCHPSGSNDFEDDRIGKFQVSWGPSNFRLLNRPILKVDNVANEGFDVEAISAVDKHICSYRTGVTWYGSTNKNYYVCGIPLVGKAEGSIDSNGPVNEQGWRPGWCGMHVVQYQKPYPNDPNSVYSFDLQIQDANGNEIGKSGDRLFIKGGEAKGMSSKLPFQVSIKPGAVDDDALWFYYGDQAFTSNDQEHHCNFGAYDNGSRRGDCGFTCDGPPPIGK
jgi:hypothetical protein